MQLNTRQIESEMERGVFVSRKEAENTTLAEALERYEREVIPEKKGAVQESMRIRIWKRTPLAKRSTASIQRKDIAAYRDARLKEVAPNTVPHVLAALSHVFTIAVKEWGMGGLANPAQQIRAPKMPAGRDRRLLPGELDRILSVTESPVLSDLARFALETGMRQEEIARMEWAHVDLKKRVLMIPLAKVEPRRIPLSVGSVRILSCLPRRRSRHMRFLLPGVGLLQGQERPTKRNAKRREKSPIRPSWSISPFMVSGMRLLAVFSRRD